MRRQTWNARDWQEELLKADGITNCLALLPSRFIEITAKEWKDQ